MAEFSFPFDVSVAGDRTVTADTFGTMLNAMVTNGVVKDADDGLAVSQSGTPAMSVSVATGRAFVGHTSKRRYYRNTSALTLTIEAADSSNPRDDLIVLEMAEATSTRSVSLKVVKGTAAGSPSDPSLTTSEATFQFAIARVRVGAGVSTIVNANITDLRSTNGFAGMALGTGEVSQLTEDTIASGDFIAFSDESETGDPSNKITVDNLMITGIPLVPEDTVAVASDYMLFLDGGASGDTNKESIADFISGVASTGLGASSGQLSVDISNLSSSITTIADDDVLMAVDTSGGGLKKVAKSVLVAGLVTGTEISNVVEDTSPELGGDLDVLERAIVTGASNRNIALTPHGTGVVRIDGTTGVDIESGAISIKHAGAESYVRFYCESSNAHYTQLQAAPHAQYSGNVTVVLPASADTLVGRATTDTLTNKTLNGGSITSGFGNIDIGSSTIDTTGAVGTGTITVADDAVINLGDEGQVIFGDTAPSTDHTATGVVVTMNSGESVTAFNAVYIRTDGEVGPADADAATSMPAIGVALESKSDGQATKILISGVLRDDTYNFNAGEDLFIGTTAGEITATAPSGSGDTVQKIGVALSADTIYVNFNTTEVLLA